MTTLTGADTEFVLRLVQRAGSWLRRRLGNRHRVGFKGPKDLVTEMDRAVERLVITALRRRFPDFAILSEEQEEGARRDPWARTSGHPRGRWIIDPLDGTTNYAHGWPHFGVSVGLEQGGRVMLGIIGRPMQGQVYLARRGRGAWCNGARLRVSAVRRIDRALVVVGLPGRRGGLAALTQAAQAWRRTGSATLDFCDVARGRFDAMWETSLKPWDVAAGSLLVQEAGGRVTGDAGGPFDLFSRDILASNGRVHAAMIHQVRGRTIRRPAGSGPGAGF